MADVGYSYDSLVASLSAIGTSSGELISLSITGKEIEFCRLLIMVIFHSMFFLATL